MISTSVPVVQCSQTYVKMGIPLAFFKQITCVEILGKIEWLTRLKRSTDCSMLKEPLLLLPVKISKIKTPKLNTSDFIE